MKFQTFFKNRCFKKFLALLAIWGILFFTELFLKTQFKYQGESFFKGYGHILREDFWKGILFLTFWHVSITAIIFYLLALIFGRKAQKLLFSFAILFGALIVLGTILSMFYKMEEAFKNNYYMLRVIEIILTWYLWFAGLIFGLWLYRKT